MFDDRFEQVISGRLEVNFEDRPVRRWYERRFGAGSRRLMVVAKDGRVRL